MSIGFRKLSAICAAIVAIVGLGDGTAKAFTSAMQQSEVSQNAPLILEHGGVNNPGELGAHYSHSSHESHASHHSHYSGR